MSTTVQSTEPQPNESKDTQAHPWGDDFDAARAYKTITDQRAREKELVDKLAAFEKAEQERADADKSELEKAIARAEKAEASAKAASRTAALAKSGLDESLHAFITGDTDEVIAEQVAKLTAALGGKGKEDDDEETTKVTPSSRPQSALTPGHGGDEVTFDADAIVAASR